MCVRDHVYSVPLATESVPNIGVRWGIEGPLRTCPPTGPRDELVKPNRTFSRHRRRLPHNGRHHVLLCINFLEREPVLAWTEKS